MKRDAEHQLTKDDTDGDEGINATEGTFQRASAEVLAKRRIVKVRRTLPSSSATGANPFAAVSVPSVAQSSFEETPAAAQDKQSAVSPKEKPTDTGVTTEGIGLQFEGKENAAETVGNVHAKTEQPYSEESKAADPVSASVTVTEPVGVAGKESEALDSNPKVEAAGNGIDEDKNTADGDANTATKAPNISSADVVDGIAAIEPVSQLSAERKEPADETIGGNPKDDGATVAKAAQVGVAETGADAVVEHDGKALGTTGTPQPEFVAKGEATPAVGQPFKAPFSFGGVSAGPTLTFANAAAGENGSSFNIKPSTSEMQPAKAAPAKEFKEAAVETGEENERELFRGRAKLYSLEERDGSSRWKECGVGPVKLNEHGESGKARLIMRTEATFRVILNTPVYAGMTLDRATERSLRFLGFDLDDTEGSKRTSFLLRFATSDILSELVDAIEAWKKTKDDA